MPEIFLPPHTVCEVDRFLVQGQHHINRMVALQGEFGARIMGIEKQLQNIHRAPDMHEGSEVCGKWSDMAEAYYHILVYGEPVS
ncbi:hypothetical protein H6770_04270 [Candidatus Peribacteria bacterium]|nr:hypothetical protein [Candidatus Peribacteria bacterium]